jgi:probable HAF family extracellular repeat protein
MNYIYNHACIFDSTGRGANIDLGTLPGGYESCANAINEMGQIVGYSDTTACLFDATGGGMNINLGSLGGTYGSSANAINDKGQIVGGAYNSSGLNRACLFDPTGRGNNIDLNTLIAPSSGWSLTVACGINNNGWIVGSGTYNGNATSFLLTPEPATLLLFGFAGLALRRKR